MAISTPTPVPVGDVPGVPVQPVPLSEIDRAPAPVAVPGATGTISLSEIDTVPVDVPVEFVPVSTSSGARGPQGPQGPTGPQGPQGFTGATGSGSGSGSIGATGATGPQGATGTAGTNGATGASGIQGLTGATGTAGTNGATGASGIQGLTGATGATGPQGDIGATGLNGADGATGPQGDIGATGADGATGPQGDIGATGADGATGPQGATGADGATGIAANTGNVTFSDQIVIGTGNPEGGDGLYLAPGNASIANSEVQYLRVRGGDYPTHIHLDTGNNAYYDQYFGADTKYVKLEANGNIVINADDGANSATWTFDSTGNLTLPSGGILYSQGSTPSGSPGNTIILQPSGSGTITNQKLMLYPTANDGDHLHMVTGNLYETELFLGSDNFYVKLANTGNVVVNTNDNTGNAAQYNFGTDGVLTIPGGMIINGNTNTLGTQTALLQPTDDLPLSFIASGANGSVTSFWAEDFANLMTSNIAAIYTPLQNTQTVRIVTGNNGGNIAIYDFDPDGMFTAAAVCATGNVFASNVIVTSSIVGSGASPAPTLSGFSSIATTPSPLANLTAVAGARAFVSDANLIAAGNFGNQISGGASNTVPVWSDGTNWYIG